MNIQINGINPSTSTKSHTHYVKCFLWEYSVEINHRKQLFPLKRLRISHRHHVEAIEHGRKELRWHIHTDLGLKPDFTLY